MWERIQGYLGSKIKKMKVENCAFPLLISQSALETEETHVKGFAAEVCFVLLPIWASVV